MSKCDLSIVLEKPDRTYAPGERITGVVRVFVNDSCECNRLTIRREWRTHGSGNLASGNMEERTLFSGRWRAGAEVTYPFEFPAPNGPQTYHGHHLNVDWYLNARADIPWAIDPKAEEEFLVVAGEPQPENYDFGPKYEPPEAKYRDERKSAGCQIPVIILMMFFGLVFFLLGFMPGGRSGSASHLIFILFALFVTALAGWLIFRVMRTPLAQRKLGRVHVGLSSGVLRPGEVITCAVRFTPLATLEINGITATLTGKETVVSGGGTSRTTHTHVLQERRLRLAAPRRARVAEEFMVEAGIPIPAGSPCTFAAENNALEWRVTVHIDIPNWPDWVREYPITVRP